MVIVMDHLHQMGVMHRDIKPENFLLTSTDDSAAVKLADFGLSTYFKPGQRFTQIVGSAYYVAPEVGRCSGVRGHHAVRVPCTCWCAHVPLWHAMGV